MAAPDPAALPCRCSGDVAIKRGENYGTILIDCEPETPLDLLKSLNA
jgi:hypothetical protein